MRGWIALSNALDGERQEAERLIGVGAGKGIEQPDFVVKKISDVREAGQWDEREYKFSYLAYLLAMVDGLFMTGVTRSRLEGNGEWADWIGLSLDELTRMTGSEAAGGRYVKFLNALPGEIARRGELRELLADHGFVWDKREGKYVLPEGAERLAGMGVYELALGVTKGQFEEH